MTYLPHPTYTGLRFFLRALVAQHGEYDADHALVLARIALSPAIDPNALERAARAAGLEVS